MRSRYDRIVDARRRSRRTGRHSASPPCDSIPRSRMAPGGPARPRPRGVVRRPRSAQDRRPADSSLRWMARCAHSRAADVGERARRARRSVAGRGRHDDAAEPMPRSASMMACVGPAPPKATSANSRGSMPALREQPCTAPSPSCAVATRSALGRGARRGLAREPSAAADRVERRARAPRLEPHPRRRGSGRGSMMPSAR